MFQQMALIGCGMMGSSLALALQEACLVRHIVGYSPDADSMAASLQRGAIHSAAASAAFAVRDADLVVLAVPVAATHSVLQAIAPSLRADAIITDVGSTKQSVLADAHAVLGTERAGQFVAAHPIAGKEHAGAAHAEARSFGGRHVIITPARSTRIKPLQAVKEMWETLGCQVQTMTPKQHDMVFAAVSHLPHMTAFALIQSILSQPAAAETLALGGSGFRDFTRIAASNPAMWRDVLLCNREEVLSQTQHLIAALQNFMRAIENDDADYLYDMIAQASHTRSQWHMTTRDNNALL